MKVAKTSLLLNFVIWPSVSIRVQKLKSSEISGNNRHENRHVSLKNYSTNDVTADYLF